jgi:hypothetical protein
MNDLIIIGSLLTTVVLIFFYVRKIEAYEDPKAKEIHEKLKLVNPLAANISIKASNQSFTEDKTRTYLCLRDEKGQYYDDNMLMYVALHELAHAISKQIDPDHKTEEFMNNFKMLLKSAENLGFYDPKLPLNYNYCPNTKEIAATNKGSTSSTALSEQFVSANTSHHNHSFADHHLHQH